MRIAFLSVSHNFYAGTKNSLDIAIGRYVKHTLEAMAGQLRPGQTITLVTNKEGEGGANSQRYQVRQPFNKGLMIGWQLWNFFRKEKFDVIHFQHEFFIYGGALKSLLITMALRRIAGSKVVITAHHVIDMDKIDRKFISENNYLYPVWLVRLGLAASYRRLFNAADLVIVHEDASKEVLVRNWEKQFPGIRDKIQVVHHGIGSRQRLNRDAAKKKLCLRADFFHVLFFGYVSRHKGLGLLLEAVKLLQDKGEKISVIVAGGEHPKLSEEKDYREFYGALRDRATQLEDACWYGFAQEAELTELFSAADLSAFPYTTRNATSGSVADSISFGAPFILSDLFENISQFRKLTFKTTPQDLAAKILEVRNTDMTEDLKKWQQEFSWESSARKQLDLYEKGSK